MIFTPPILHFIHYYSNDSTTRRWFSAAYFCLPQLFDASFLYLTTHHYSNTFIDFARMSSPSIYYAFTFDEPPRCASPRRYDDY
jgi:hypothetical protein